MGAARLPYEADPLAHAAQLIATGRPIEAADFLRKRIDAGRGGLLARLALVQALRGAGNLQAALKAAREAVSLNPTVAQAIVALGDCLMAAGHLPAAIGEFQRALRLEPDLVAARIGLGRAWLEAGEAERALEQLRPVEGSAALVERAEKMRAQKRSDPNYVRHLFDQFSSDYDVRMRAQLSYRAPEILRELAALVMPGVKGLAALDLGCGTGLTGEAFADIVSTLDGIDLSPAMIEKARARGLYQALAVADIETALSAGRADYDLLLAADTLVYLGDLEATFRGAARRLNPGGFFLFTVEANSAESFVLGPKRRWRHSEQYLRTMAASCKFDIAGILSCSPRSEAQVPVEGLACALQKPLGS